MLLAPACIYIRDFAVSTFWTLTPPQAEQWDIKVYLLELELLLKNAGHGVSVWLHNVLWSADQCVHALLSMMFA
jgi:hypothetical protein